MYNNFPSCSSSIQNSRDTDINAKSNQNSNQFNPNIYYEYATEKYFYPNNIEQYYTLSTQKKSENNSNRNEFSQNQENSHVHLSKPIEQRNNNFGQIQQNYYQQQENDLQCSINSCPQIEHGNEVQYDPRYNYWQELPNVIVEGSAMNIENHYMQVHKSQQSRQIMNELTVPIGIISYNEIDAENLSIGHQEVSVEQLQITTQGREKRPRKWTRHNFSKDEKEALEAAFQKTHRPSDEQMNAIAFSYRLRFNSVKFFFQNRRTKLKKERH
ncbi:hypothetical protein ACOME3_003854 [Neoechinorhynchus agilis]